MIIVPAYIYKLAKFGDFMSCGLKVILKNASSHVYTNTHHDITDLVKHEMVNLNILRTDHNFSTK